MDIIDITACPKSLPNIISRSTYEKNFYVEFPSQVLLMIFLKLYVQEVLTHFMCSSSSGAYSVDSSFDRIMFSTRW